MWAGGVTSNAARVRALVAEGESVLRLSTAGDLGGALEIAPASVIDGLHTFELADLSPATRYFYAVGDAIGSVKTFSAGAAPVRIAFGSCAETGSDHPVFSTVSGTDPDLFIHLGDLHYENIDVADLRLYRRALRKVFGSPLQAYLYANTPAAYVWDDHDYGRNNSDRSSASRSAAWRAYRELVPHHPLAAEDSIHHAFSIGRVRIVLLDLRSERDPGSTMLGKAQRSWFLEELDRSSRTHALVVVGSSVTWIGDDSDTWGGFPKEREEIARFIRERSIENLVMISGDAHMATFDDGRNNRYAGSRDPGFPIFFGSCFDKRGSKKGGPYSGEVIKGAGHFGLLEIDDDGTSPLEVRFTARDWRDRAVLRHELVVPR